MTEFSRVKMSVRATVFAVSRSVAVGLAITLAACTTIPEKSGSPKDDVAASGSSPAELERRAVERWQLLIDNKPEEAYAYLTPGYRTTMSQQEYTRSALVGTLKWRSVTWRSSECRTQDACEAQVLIEYSARMSGAGDVSSVNLQKENWLRIDGEWFFLPNP